MAKAVFLDRDETLNPDSGYISKPEHFSLYPWIPTELRRLKDAGFFLIVVSNQSGIGRGLINPEDLLLIHKKLNQILKDTVDIEIDGFGICPHHPEDVCSCRKPKPKLIIEQAAKLSVNLKESYMIGDRNSDYEAGLNAGVLKSFLIKAGDETSFREVVDQILGSKSKN